MCVQLIDYTWTSQFMVRAQVNNFVETSNSCYKQRDIRWLLLDASGMIQLSFFESSLRVRNLESLSEYCGFPDTWIYCIVASRANMQKWRLFYYIMYNNDNKSIFGKTNFGRLLLLNRISYELLVYTNIYLLFMSFCNKTIVFFEC